MTMSHDSPSNLERQAEATRERLSDTLDELRDRLTPGQVMDEMMTYTKDGGITLLRSLGEAAKANPIPTLLIGAGCAMLLTGRGRTSSYFGGYSDDEDEVAHRMAQGYSGRGARAEHRYGSNGGRVGSGSMTGRVSDGASSMADRASGAASSVADRASGMASSVADQASGTAASASHAASDAARRVREAAGDFSERASETYDEYAEDLRESSSAAARYARQQANWAGRQVQRGWSTMVEEQPLVVAAIGVALGAALGAVLPSTRMEDEAIGETSDRVKRAAVETAGEQYEHAKTAVGKAVDGIATDAEEHGLTREGVREMARDLGDKVKTVASNAGETLKTETGLSSGSSSPGGSSTGGSSTGGSASASSGTSGAGGSGQADKAAAAKSGGNKPSAAPSKPDALGSRKAGV